MNLFKIPCYQPSTIQYFDTDDVYIAFSSFLQSFGNQGATWSCVINSICSLSWAPIPLFHCLRALDEASDKEKNVENFKIDLEQINHFVVKSLKCQDPLIRGAAQECLLKSLFNLSQSGSLFNDKNISDLKNFLKGFHGPRKIIIRGTELYAKICEFIKDILVNLDDDENSLLFVMKCDVFKLDIFTQTWILNVVKSIKENAFRLYGPNITEDIFKIGSVIQCLMKPIPRVGRDHLEHKKNTDYLSETTIQKLDADFAEIVIDNLNKIPVENIDVSLGILKYACNFQTFQHKIVEKLKILPNVSLQELKFVAEFIEEFDSKEEITIDIIEHVKKKRFPKINQQSLSGSDSSLHLG